MRRLLSALWLLAVAVAVWLVYGATGGPRFELVGVAVVGQAPPPADERLEIELLFQNIPRPLEVLARWEAPDGEESRQTLELTPGDGTVTLSLSGPLIAAGEHSLTMLSTTPTDEQTLTELTFQVPARELDFALEVEYGEDSLLGVFDYRHAPVGAQLRGEWLFDGGTIPESARRLSLEAGAGRAEFRLEPHPGIPLPPGEYLLLLELDGAYLAERRLILRSGSPDPGDR